MRSFSQWLNEEVTAPGRITVRQQNPPMNTKPSLKVLLFGSVGALAFTTSLIAGPGVDYWKRMSDVREAAPVPKTEMTVKCADMKIVPIAETKKDWPNARGPLVTTTTGTELVCTSCITGSTTAKRSWMNGKGPLVYTPAKVQHRCQGDCCSGDSHGKS